MTILLIGTQLLLLLCLLHPGGATHKSHYHRRKYEEAQATKRQYFYQPYNKLHNPFITRQAYNPFFYKQNIAPYYQKLLRNQPYNEPDNHASMMLNLPGKHANVNSIVQTGIPLQLPGPSSTFCDDTVAARKGSFKIDDGLVKGFGTYEFVGDEVDIDLSIKISYQECKPKPSTTEAPAPGEAGEKPKPTPGGSGGETTPAPGGGGGETTPAPGGGGEKTTPAPGEGGEKTTPAPEGGGEKTTPAPGGGEGETTPAPGGGEGETTPAPGGGEGETTPAPGEGEEDVAAFEKEALKAHNDYRARHDAPPMTLNKDMSASATEWAKELGDNDKFEHSPSEKRNNQGENIAAWCDSKGETATQVTKRWYDEVCDPGYDFSRNDMDWGAGHFTQIAWIKSTELGIGFYDKKRDDGFVCRTIVARYREPGNGGGAFLESVKKGSFDKNKDCKKK